MTNIFDVPDKIREYTKKIDDQSIDGLEGENNSLGYKVEEIERHFHQNERWFGLAATPVGETHRADRIDVGINPFRIDAGNNLWSAWYQVLGSSDTPADTGNVKFDGHRLMVTAAERNAVYFMQFGVGATGAAALLAGTYTEVVYKPVSNQIDAAPVDIMTRRADVGSKLWARCICPGQNTATIDFYFGIHEYEG